MSPTIEASQRHPRPTVRRPRLSETKVLLLVGVVVALGLPFALSGFQTLELTYALILAIAILGLNVLTGFSGQISLGHGAFMAIGAFTTAIGIHRFGLPYLATLPLAALVCGGLGLVIGRAGARLEGIYLALATFALGVAIPDVLKKGTDLTGGVKGISLPPVTSPIATLTDDQFFYLLCLATVAALFWLAANILAGRHRPRLAQRARRRAGRGRVRRERRVLQDAGVRAECRLRRRRRRPVRPGDCLRQR
jgi:branched-chain amino acid transport system permease protein